MYLTTTPPDVIPTDDPRVAFKDVDVAVLVGAMPRREGMERKDLLKANAKIFETQGKALNDVAKKTVKVSWVGMTVISLPIVSRINGSKENVAFMYAECSYMYFISNDLF